VDNLKSAGIEISAFIDPEVDQIKAANRLGISTVELNTGKFAENYNDMKFAFFLDKIAQAAAFARKLKIRVLAGHGLNYQNVSHIVRIREIEELNIGHSIVANAAYLGMQRAVEKMKELLK
jgi:pyridoxine 5-phosphate synthase